MGDNNWNVLNKFRKHGKGDSPKPITPITPKFGQVRRDENGIGYWLEPHHLSELARLNQQIDDDDEFWKAFADLRARHHIKPLAAPAKRERWHDSEYEYKGAKWTDPTKNKGSLSEWWTGSKYWGGSSDDTKLALALKAARVTVNVIDDNKDSRMVVRFATENDMENYTSFSTNEVVISPKPILDNKLTDGEAFDVISGLGLHEGSHVKYTRKVMLQVAGITPLTTGSLLVNLLEDMRIEALTSLEFPGFAAYFQKTLDYMWDSRPNKDKHYGPDLVSKLNAVIGFLKWPQHYTEAEFADELAWWTEWRHRYADDGSNARVLAEEGIAHLRLPNEEEKKGGLTSQANRDLDAQEGMEKQFRESMISIDQIIDEVLKRLGRRLNRDFCSHSSDKKAPNSTINSKQAETVLERVEEQIERHGALVLGEGCSNPPLIVTKPLENERSRYYGKRRNEAMVRKYKRAFMLRPAKPVHTTKLTKDGKVDSTQLWRWAGDDWRVFQKREIHAEVNARVYLLVDLSGSMNGPKLDAAQQIAQIFVEALDSTDGVTPKVWGHTGDGGEMASQIFRIWEPGDPKARMGLISSLFHGNNYDGHAISYVVKQMEQDAQPGEQRIIIVLSDGLPSGSGYGGQPGMQHTRKVTDGADRKGIRILQIAIDDSLDAVRQGAMFKEFIPFAPGDSLDVLPARLTKWLAKVL